jgi:hypothetical protein
MTRIIKGFAVDWGGASLYAIRSRAMAAGGAEVPAGCLSALRLADLFDLAGGGAAGVLHGTGGNLAPAP